MVLTRKIVVVLLHPMASGAACIKETEEALAW